MTAESGDRVNVKEQWQWVVGRRRMVMGVLEKSLRERMKRMEWWVTPREVRGRLGFERGWDLNRIIWSVGATEN